MQHLADSGLLGPKLVRPGARQFWPKSARNRPRLARFDPSCPGHPPALDRVQNLGRHRPWSARLLPNSAQIGRLRPRIHRRWPEFDPTRPRVDQRQGPEPPTFRTNLTEVGPTSTRLTPDWQGIDQSWHDVDQIGPDFCRNWREFGQIRPKID